MGVDMEKQSSTKDVDSSKQRKKGVFSLFRKKKGEKKQGRNTPSPVSVTSSERSSKPHYDKDGRRVITSFNSDGVNPSDVQMPKKGGHRDPSAPHQNPSARDSAFKGPPRYDWIDIETAAAVKLQSIYRRNKVMDCLEREGKSTAQIRNRRRKRKTKKGLVVGEDTPSLMHCCGVGLVFGDATEEDDEVVKEYQRSQFYEKRQEKEKKEEVLRTSHWKNKPDKKVLECVEVVDSFDSE